MSTCSCRQVKSAQETRLGMEKRSDAASRTRFVTCRPTKSLVSLAESSKTATSASAKICTVSSDGSASRRCGVAVRGVAFAALVEEEPARCSL